jgi:Na+:H+ antiporter, NhaA family
VQIKMMRAFLKLESSAGIVLVCAAVLALLVNNSPWSSYYEAFWAHPVGFDLAFLHLHKPLLLWVNEGLMTLFFFLVGLEIKREMRAGELNTQKKRLLPGVAAVGGMLLPALIYLVINHANPVVLKGWAIPTATDIAFSLGILALLGSRIPVALKIFLTALAIFDDLAGIVIIALFYTQAIAWPLLVAAGCLLVLLWCLNRFQVRWLGWYFLVAAVLWVCVLKSGVHATLSGVALAFAIPMHDVKRPGHSPLKMLEHRLHPWVAFAILPVFAFANAGVSFAGMQASQWLSPLTLGIAAGLFLGKQWGVASACWLGMRFGWFTMPLRVSWRALYGVGLLSGVGFTMSLFIGSLAFGGSDAHHMVSVRLGVLVGSLLSGAVGYLLLRGLPLRASAAS